MNKKNLPVYKNRYHLYLRKINRSQSAQFEYFTMFIFIHLSLIYHMTLRLGVK